MRFAAWKIVRMLQCLFSCRKLVKTKLILFMEFFVYIFTIFGVRTVLYFPESLSLPFSSSPQLSSYWRWHKRRHAMRISNINQKNHSKAWGLSNIRTVYDTQSDFVRFKQYKNKNEADSGDSTTLPSAGMNMMRAIGLVCIWRVLMPGKIHTTSTYAPRIATDPFFSVIMNILQFTLPLSTYLKEKYFQLYYIFNFS